MAGASTTIESLVVELGLDPSKFTQGQADALNAYKKTIDQAVSGGKAIEDQGAKVQDFFAKFKREALTLTAIFLGGRGIQQFVSDVTRLDAATGRVALTTGIATRELGAWQGAIEQNGGSAESATSALAGLSGEMSKFMVTGQTGMLPVLNRLGVSLFDYNHQLRTSDQLLLEISEKVRGMDPRTANAFLGMIPGMNQDMINLLIQGREAVERYLQSARRAGTTTRESAEAAQEYQRQMANLERSATSLGRSLFTTLAPAINAVAESLAKLVQSWNKSVGSPEDKAQEKDFRGNVRRRLGDPRDFMEWLMGPDTANQVYGPRGAAEPKGGRDLMFPPGASPTSGAAPSPAEQEAYIRAAAAKRGIDPNVAVAVAKSEGLYNWQSTVIQRNGQREPSFGPFQLYMGGGLGNKFQSQTGLDPRDTSTWQKQVDFALDEARKGGWGPWHGWKGMPWAGIGAPPAGGEPQEGGRRSISTTTVTIQNINLPNVSDAQGFTRELKPAMERLQFGAPANYGMD